MAKISPVDSLKESIRLLVIQQAEEREIVKQQLKVTYESLKLVNIFKSSIKELTGSTELKGNLFESITALLTGFITNKILVNSKSNIFTRILGLFMQYGVTTLVARNAELIRDFLSGLIDKFLKNQKSEEAPQPEAETE
jgi:hypothetical protein